MIGAAGDGQADSRGKESHPSPSSHKEPTTPRTLVLGRAGRVPQNVAQGPGIPAPPFLLLLQEGEALGGGGRKGKQLEPGFRLLSQPPASPRPPGGKGKLFQVSSGRTRRARQGSGVQPILPETGGMERPCVG